MGNIFFEIAIIISIAAILAIIFKFLKQPPILAYILTGIIVGPIGLFHIQHKEVLHAFGEFGVTFLLFMLGLELKLKELKSVGKTALIAGLSQIAFTTIIGYGISLLLGFSQISSIYIAIGLTFSSTIIIIKLLSEKRDTTSLYGKLSLAMLLAQDIVAILILIFLSSFTKGFEAFTFVDTITILIKGIIIFSTIILLSKSILPKIMDTISNSQETLFLFSIAWAIGLAALVSSPLFGFSIEIGGFLAGISLANSTENFQIIARTRALRDFFITIFFVLLGMNMVLSNMLLAIIPAVILSLFVLLGNPLIVMVILGIIGYKKRTSFLAGLTMAQISEFSLILIFLGNKIGHINEEVVTIITLVAIITFAASTYMILNGNSLYENLKPYLSVFQRKSPKEEYSNDEVQFSDHIVLIGGNRTGQGILDSLEVSDKNIIVVDFDPDIINFFKDKNIPLIFGDITDPEIQEIAKIEKAKLIISTVQDVKDNLYLIQAFRKKQKRGKIIVLAKDKIDANLLYKGGADFVIIPHLSGGIHIASILQDENLSLRKNYDFKA